MIVLGIESATVSLGVALIDDDVVLAQAHAPAGRRHVEALHPLISSVLAAGGCVIGELDAVVVDVGPGRFTGMRVGLATTAALAFGLDIAVVGVRSTSTLLAGADDARARATHLVAAVDLRRGELAVELGEDDALMAMTPEELILLLDSRYGTDEVLLLGDGALWYRSVIEEGVKSVRVQFSEELEGAPDPVVLAKLGRQALLNGAQQDPFALEPVYLREADVKINWTTRAASTTTTGLS